MIAKDNAMVAWLKREDARDRQRRESYRRSWPKMLLRKYGLDAETWARTYNAQGGRCLTCGSSLDENGARPPCVDHSHETGEARGLICGPCNSALAGARDNPRVLRRLAEYLETAPHWYRGAA